jgi:hypothetical protein
MTTRYPTTLTFAERVVRGLIVLNVLYGTGILLLLTATLLAPALVFRALIGKPATDANGALQWMRLLMVVGLAAVPVAHIILTRLRAMLLTVRVGDPFLVENGRRLNAIAFGVLALELLHLIVGAIAKSDAFAALGIHLGWSFSITPWVAALLLFVLAQVFEHGARMRADLAGTV